MVLYSAVSSPLDRWKRFTLSFPGRPVHSDTVLGFSWKHSSHAAIAQRLFTHISTTVYSQVLIYTAESTEASWSERKCPNFETVTTGIRTRALSIASPAFYQLSYRSPCLPLLLPLEFRMDRELYLSSSPNCLSGFWIKYGWELTYESQFFRAIPGGSHLKVIVAARITPLEAQEVSSYPESSTRAFQLRCLIISLPHFLVVVFFQSSVKRVINRTTLEGIQLGLMPMMAGVSYSSMSHLRLPGNADCQHWLTSGGSL